MERMKYVDEDRLWFAAAKKVKEREYWLGKLAGEPVKSSFPSLEGQTGSPGASGHAEPAAFRFTPQVSAGLLMLSAGSDIRLHIVLVSLLTILLARYTGNDDIILGTPISKSDRPEELINKVVAIRNRLSDDLTFKELLLQVRQSVIEADEHRNYPLEVLLRQLNLPAAPFTVVILLENIHDKRYLDQVEVEVVFAFLRGEAGITGQVELRGAPYLLSIVQRAVGHFQGLAEQVLADLEIRLADIEFLSVDEKKQLLYDFNDTTAGYPFEKNIHRLFVEQVEKTPNRTAVVGQSETLTRQVSLTYNELSRQAGHLAGILIEKGIKCDTIVGILVGRTIEMIAGILAILKAGGAYLPIDPQYPQERIDFMLSDSGAAILLTQHNFFDRGRHIKNWLGDVVFIQPGSDSPCLIELPSSPESPAGSLAYIIYSSGTTGRPKGVMVEHRNIVNLVTGLNQSIYSQYHDHLNIALVAPYVFDASVQQIFAVLSLGHSLWIVPEEIRVDGGALKEFYRVYGIDISDGTPAHLHLMVEEGERGPGMKHFIIGGEALPHGLAGDFLNLFGIPAPKITNVYGPTECCVDNTAFEISKGDIDKISSIPIGKPLSNQQIYIINQRELMQPIGAPGELCIGGDSIGRGYLNNPESTGDKFKTQNEEYKKFFGGSRGAILQKSSPGRLKLYKTGDSARWLADGNIEFLGRIDRQVKIRGYRIELEEIENHLINYTHHTDTGIHWEAPDKSETVHCKRCVLSASYPGIDFDREGVCSICRDYEKIQSQAAAYFKTINDFQGLVEKAGAAKKSEYDCLLLFSGGKDSSYVLYRLVEMGLKVLAFTFDNGYISETAFANIRRNTTRLGVDSMVCTTPKMKGIFTESLNQDHTVCTGCFKALTTISTQIALEKNINMVITGLSRGQIFETKLQGLYRQGITDVKEVEEKLLLFRKMYHSGGDKISRLLNAYRSRTAAENRENNGYGQYRQPCENPGDIPIGHFKDEVFREIHFVDFFRYDDADLERIKAYLKDRDTYWQQPGDTGFCSTNCIINDVGIYAFTRKNGYHNYASPLSWSCRLGKITREEALSELEFEPDLPKIRRILEETGYFDRPIRDACVVDMEDKGGSKYLCAYIVPGKTGSLEEGNIGRELREYLSRVLPDYMIPSHFIPLEKLPLTPNGKVDRKALPKPVFKAGRRETALLTPVEAQLAEIWNMVLDIDGQLNSTDNFFELGGHSLKASLLSAQIWKEFNCQVSLTKIFETPTIRALAQYISANSQGKYFSIKRIEKKEYYRLSPAQKRLYLLYRMDPNSTGYNAPSVMTAEGKIDETRWLAAFKKLIARHEGLRTSFVMIADEPVQRIHNPQDIEFSLEYHENGETQESYHLMARRFIRPFDLSAAPLLRLTLVEIAEQKHLLICDMHHIISDGVSNSILINDFMALYAGKDEEELSPLPIQYRDYARWQLQRLADEPIKKQETYWLAEFADEIPVLDLPTDFARPQVQSMAGEMLRFQPGPEETQGLRMLALQHETTLFMVLLALFNVLLSRLNSQEEVVVGSATAGRTAPELDQVIGYFVNTLAIKNYPAGEKTFRDFLGEVREKTLADFDNQEYQFEELVEKLAIKRDIGRNPLFDAVIALQNLDAAELQIPGLKLTPYSFHSGISKFDLVFNCEETENDIFISVEYCTRLFKKETIERFVEYFKRIASRVIANPGVVLGEIEILSPLEKEEIILGLNENFAPTPTDKSIRRLFEDQASCTPDYIALIDPGQAAGSAADTTRSCGSLSYRELNRRANRLAEALRKKGAAPDTIVGVMMERSLDMIIATLAVLKAGAAYLPIDPTYPEERIKFMLDDSSVKILLTRSSAIENHSFTALQGLDSLALPAEHYRTAPRPQFTDLDALQPVDRSLVDYDKYKRYIGQAMVKNAISLQATRGCPYQCAYCHKIWPRNHIHRSAENIFAEVRHFYDLGVRKFVFIDDIFNINKKNSAQFFQLVIDHNLKLQIFFPNGVRGDILTKDYIDLMMKAGTMSIALALETASPRLQKMIGKNLDLEKFRENLEYICRQYPHVILELFTMHGFPTETEEEALQTLDFIKSLRWVHFPYVHILKIYPSTRMAEIAREHGIPHKEIVHSANLAFHQLPTTLPFDKSFTHKYQADFLNRYFLLKERLLDVFPYQMKILDEDEMVQKYNSYLPIEIKSVRDLLDFAHIQPQEIDLKSQSQQTAPAFHRLNLDNPPQGEADEDALRILLIDISQYFSRDKRKMLYDVVEPPLGLMYLMTDLKRQYGGKIKGRIAKSRIDFDSYRDLKRSIEDFKPHLIGMRTLTYYKDFFHQTAAVIRQWGIDVPIIAGGPYATSDYPSLLNDRNIDLVVLGEGEITLREIVSNMLANGRKLPPQAELKQIAGIALAPQISGREIFYVDHFQEALDKEEARNLTNSESPRDAAYVIYTSGTTGSPKGVMVEQRNLTALMATGRDLFGFHDRDVWTMFHSYCFDFSVWEMYGALLFGGKLVLIPRMVARDPGAYIQLLRKEQTTILNQTPTVFYQLVEEEMKSPSRQMNLRCVIFGGEALKPGKLKPWYEKYPRTELINMYGITETTVHVTIKEITSKEIDANISNIGKPIPTLTSFIMNRQMCLQPPRVPGELCVGGQGVARGYLNRPELTAEKFASGGQGTFLKNRPLHPQKTFDKNFCGGQGGSFLEKRPLLAEGARIYKSGDLAKMNDHGEMEYLGRIDLQVKIRGNRVEIGEVERRLLNIKEIEEALVIARQDDKGNAYLCAYIRSVGQDFTTPELREMLSRGMPDYMIPSFFIPIEKFPVTASGKLDRRKLPLPQGLRPELASRYAAPQTGAARKIAAIWQEVLKLDKVGIHDNFFDLGGTSLDIVRLNNRLKEVLEKEIPVVTLFEYPTIHTFVQHIALDSAGVPAPPQEEVSQAAARLKQGREKMKGRKKQIENLPV